jgi:uracil-DNA glycosylase
LRALALTPLDEVRVVILGQDPYHGAGQAEGLAFSVAPGEKIPPSLRNIFKELQRDLGLPPAASGSLVRWSQQGVLLLNTSLTVEEGLPASHAHQGWEALTDAILQTVSQAERPLVFMLWGAHAQGKRALIESSPHRAQHLVQVANHPSPLSASRPPAPFLGCGHFSKANQFLVSQKVGPLVW